PKHTSSRTIFRAPNISLLQTNLAAEISAGKVEARLGDMIHLDFADGELDAVVGLYSIPHLPREEQAELLRRVGKWVKPSGRLLGTFTGKEIEGSVRMRWLGEEERNREMRCIGALGLRGKADASSRKPDSGLRLQNLRGTRAQIRISSGCWSKRSSEGF
ncbi:hypothetical protein C8J57DRAFT_1557711, partial [Mycena rebaudengoi]